MEVDVHASELGDEPGEVFGGVVAGDVQRLGDDLLGSEGLQVGKGLFPAPGGSDFPPLAEAEPCHFKPDARGGAYDDDAFHGGP